jgi:sialic acid synthase
MVKVIAEIGCNHKGSFQIAKQLVDSAVKCGVWACKFQKRNNHELLGDAYDKPHPVPENSYGGTYGEHRDYLEFSLEQHKELKGYCESKGVVYSTSVWDISSAKDIISLNPEFIKIPSACNTHRELYEAIKFAKIEDSQNEKINGSQEYKGQIHVSLGMLDQDEMIDLIDYLIAMFPIDRLVFYICTSSYPARNEDICLEDIQNIKVIISQSLKLDFDKIKVGFSGHHKGIQIDNAAVAVGAEYIERHFTLDRTWKGTDHAASLEPHGLEKLVRDVTIVAGCLKSKLDLSEEEMVQRKKHKKFFLS